MAYTNTDEGLKMSKSFKRPVNNAITLDIELLDEVMNNLGIVNEYSEKTVSQIFSTIKTSICNEISMAGRNARLSGYDEKIYCFYKRLMGYYEKAILIYEDSKRIQFSENVRDILEGINSILLLQHRQKDEYKTHEEINPILDERKAIISKSVASFIKTYEKKQKFAVARNVQRYSEDIILSKIEKFNSDELFKGVLSEIVKSCFGDLYKMYCEELKKCTLRVNDLNGRSVLNSYYTMLEEEQKLLTTIIKVQVSAVEEELKKYDSSMPEYSIYEMLSALREGYQYLGKDMTEVNSWFSESENKNQNFEIYAYNEFEQRMYEFCLQDLRSIIKFDKKDELVTLGYKFSLIKEQLRKDFFSIVDFETKYCNVNFKVYELNKKISEQMFMTDEMTVAFKRINDFYYENEEQLLNINSSETSSKIIEIIKGISETIEIKIENIKEQKTAYSKSVKDVIDNFKQEELELQKEDIKLSFENAFLEWKEHILIFDRETVLDEMTQIFEDEISNGICSEFIRKFNKIETNYINNINKKTLQFKKESLLYEISTFEEIIQYSVFRLKEVEDDIVKEYVRVIEAVNEQLITILNKNFIQIIKPKPHDQFDGREHEVLMAEKNAEFKKGEVIKLMNSGYKENDIVILRANVIGAK